MTDASGESIFSYRTVPTWPIVMRLFIVDNACLPGLKLSRVSIQNYQQIDKLTLSTRPYPVRRSYSHLRMSILCTDILVPMTMTMITTARSRWGSSFTAWYKNASPFPKLRWDRPRWSSLLNQSLKVSISSSSNTYAVLCSMHPAATLLLFLPSNTIGQANKSQTIGISKLKRWRN